MKKLCSKTSFWILLGSLITIMTLIPYFILGEGSIVTYHDQLDGEVINYMLHAKYLFQGVSFYPELMNGIPANGIAVPAPGFILLYRFFRPFTAFLISLALIRLVGYLSMFFLLKEFIDQKFIVFLCSAAFMLLPFYPVYGLCIPGQPLIWMIYIKIRKNQMKWFHLMLAVSYVLFSSLALVGYAVLLALCFVTFVEFMRKEYRHVFWMVGTIGIMSCLYAVLNTSLIRQLIGLDKGFVSHKSEMVRNAKSWSTSLKTVLLTGVDYAESEQRFMLPFLCLSVLLYLIVRRKGKASGDLVKSFRLMLFSLIAILCIGVFYTVYHSEPIVAFLNSRTGILHDFNLDRFTWLTPVFWFVAFALSLNMIRISCSVLCSLQSFRVRMKYLGSYIAVAGGSVLCLAALWYGELKYNVAKLIKPDYYMMTWEQFYAEDLFTEIRNTIGKDPSQYRVVSLGIYSAAAAYNGFYCLDAYSNNYQLEYKQEFRQVIEKELEKNEYIRSYFDHWGNRCCIVTKECGTYFNIEKKWNPGFHDLDIDTKKLKAMGCEYLFSGTWILNAEELSLELLKDTPFVSDGSWYNIYVYHLR